MGDSGFNIGIDARMERYGEIKRVELPPKGKVFSCYKRNTLYLYEQPPVLPNRVPSIGPSLLPSSKPSAVPSVEPSSIPSVLPSRVPSINQSLLPSVVPSVEPSSIPSVLSNRVPSINPSLLPSVVPSVEPSSIPSVLSNRVPSINPSLLPSVVPSVEPSSIPSMLPNRVPSINPSVVSSVLPSRVSIIDLNYRSISRNKCAEECSGITIKVNNDNIKEKISDNSQNKDVVKCFNTTHVTTMYQLFRESGYNGDLSCWDISSVTNISVSNYSNHKRIFNKCLPMLDTYI